MIKFTVLARAIDGGLIHKVGEINAENWKAARQDAMVKYWPGLADGEQMIVANPHQLKKYWVWKA